MFIKPAVVHTGLHVGLATKYSVVSMLSVDLTLTFDF